MNDIISIDELLNKNSDLDIYKYYSTRSKESLILEFGLIACGYNLYKYNCKQNRLNLCA